MLLAPAPRVLLAPAPCMLLVCRGASCRHLCALARPVCVDAAALAPRDTVTAVAHVRAAWPARMYANTPDGRGVRRAACGVRCAAYGGVRPAVVCGVRAGRPRRAAHAGVWGGGRATGRMCTYTSPRWATARWPCREGRAVRDVPSGTCRQGRAVRDVPSGTCRQGRAVRDVPSGTCRARGAKLSLPGRVVKKRGETRTCKR
jgi:hypothetical protein